jgi:3-oxoacyl-[acyl-carrier protein] reductase
MNLNLQDRRVLVTGASHGIGFGIARGFVDEGARVAITGRDLPRLNKAVSELDANTIASPGDLTKPGAIRRILAKVEKCWGELDILILNLGSGKSIPSADAAEWNRVLELNLVSAMETLRQATPLLSKGRNPAVVFIGSIAGIEALGAPIAYGAAKAALTHAMKSAARLLAPNGIRVNMVAPGNIFSPGGTWDKKLGENKRAVEAMLASQVPMRRLGGIEEVVAPVLFLASSKSSFVTGTCLVVDGGQTRS